MGALTAFGSSKDVAKVLAIWVHGGRVYDAAIADGTHS